MNKSLSYAPTVEIEQSAEAAKILLDQALDRASEIILGKRLELRLAFVCVLAGGHLLIEDLPGVGKTTLAHLLGKLLGFSFQRIQFTSDLLPADVIGVSIFDRETSVFSFHRGPIFTQLLLADEVNRATPRAQSALLEAMEERQVTVDGETYPLPDPFFVIATQNPSDQIGTFPLPESQLDRFLMRISIGYPSREAELELLSGEPRRLMLNRIEALFDIAKLRQLQQQSTSVHVAEPLLNYIQDLLSFSRSAPMFTQGLSPRAGLAIVQAAKAWALMDGRNHVLPEDVQSILPSVVAHRLGGGFDGRDSDLAAQLIKAVPIP
ncbi:MAG: MoxR-like ATPase [Gammaproteobacteria bacterium]|jgi:MoxR-like ATPase